MRLKNSRKLFNSLLVLTMIFSMLFPLTGTAAAARQTKAEQFSQTSLNEMKLLIAQQTEALSGPAELHPDLQNLSGDEEVSVIVELKEYPVALVKGINKAAGKTTSQAEEKTIQQKVVSQQQKFKNNVSAKGIKAKYGFSYNYAFNGMALKLKASEVKELLKDENVALIEPDVERHALGNPSPSDAVKPAMNTSSPFLNVPGVWKLGYEGKGVKVAVLDTGIDYNHPEFQGGVYKGGFNFIDQSSSTNYARTRAADDPYETTPLDRPANKAEFDANGSAFYTEHGTHVAGTIAAQGNNPFGIKGLAPKVELYAYRVLGAYGSGANSGIIAAIDKAVQEKIDIINLSLGGSNNNQVSSDAIAINNAALAGVTACIATGNDGPNRGTIGSPGVAAFAISVANSTVPEKTMKGTANISLDGADAKSYNMDLMGWKFSTDPGTLLNGTYDLVSVPNVGADADYAGLNVNGKVALVARGSIAFVDKIAAAKKAGAVGIIVYNNVAGNIGIFLGDSFAFIPTFDMSKADGDALKAAMATQKATVTFNNFTSGTTAGDDINSSSSRGPANPNFDLKPDVSAPGTDIMSSVPRYGKDFPTADYSEAYERFTGTSMATPHVAGIAALLKSEHPDWTPFDIKVAISNTAKQLDAAKFDVFSQGPGRVQPYQAATTEALAYSLDTTSFSGKVYDNIKGTITFGNVTPGANPLTIKKTIKVKNLKDYAGNYTVSVETTKKASGTIANAAVTVDQSSFTLDASGEKLVTVTLTVPAGSGSSGNEILGYVHITNGQTNLNLPFAGNFSPPTGLKSFSIDSAHISPNADGKLDSTTVRYEFYNSQKYTTMELWDAQNQEAGKYGDGYLGTTLATTSVTTGAKSLVFNGQYTSYDTSKKVLAADGVYTLDLTTYNTSNPATVTAVVASGWVGPVYVKTSKPTIVAQDSYTTSDANFNINAAILDKYVDWKSVVEDVFGEDYDVNAKLAAKYDVTNANGEKVGGTTPITLNQDGTFTLALNGLSEGDNRVTITVTDVAQNTATKTFTVTKTADNATPGKGKLFLNNNPMENITFSVYSGSGDNKVWYDFTTDENGNFTHNLADGTYNIDGVWASPTWYPLNSSFTIKNGLVNGTKTLVINAENYQLPVNPSNNVAGTLTKNGEGYANIVFSFHTVGGTGTDWYDTRTDSKGKFAFQAPDGTYQIDGIWDGNLGKWYQLDQQFTVAGGKLSDATELLVNITAEKLSTVSGKLTQGGAPLANITFSIHTTTGTESWYDATTDAKGNFQFVLADGSYKLEGIWLGAENKWYSLAKEFTVSGSQALNVDLPAPAAQNVKGTLTKGTAALGGVVFSFHNGDQWYDVTTKADGSFGTIVPDGTYTIEGIWLSAEAKWYVLGSQFTVTNGKLVGQDQVNINLQ